MEQMDAIKQWKIVENMIQGRFTTDFNENHDPSNGQFTSGSGGGGNILLWRCD